MSSKAPLRPMQVCAALRAARSGSAKTAFRQFGREKSRPDRIGGDPVLGPCFGHGAGQLANTRLGRAISDATRERPASSAARQNSRSVPSLWPSSRDERLAEKERGGEVEVHRHVPALIRHVIAVSRVLMPAAWTTISGAPNGFCDLRAQCRQSGRVCDRSAATRRPHCPCLGWPSRPAHQPGGPRRQPLRRPQPRQSLRAAQGPQLAPVTQATRPVRSKRSRGSAIWRQVKVFAGEVFGQTHIRGASMAFHAFQPGNPCCGFGDAFGAFARGLLPCDDLHVLVDRQDRRYRSPHLMSAARGSCRTPCRHRTRWFLRPGTANHSRSDGPATTPGLRPERSGALARSRPSTPPFLRGLHKR